MNDIERSSFGTCPACGSAVETKTVDTGGEHIAMTHHVEPGDDVSTRCKYDDGPFIGGPKRAEKFPGDTYL